MCGWCSDERVHDLFLGLADVAHNATAVCMATIAFAPVAGFGTVTSTAKTGR